MAADTQPKAVNGNYGAHHPYAQAEPFQPSQSSNASTSTAVASTFGDEASVATAAVPSESTGAGEANKPPSKDEVGWYFVESYYTTLSKNPETLYVSHLSRGVCRIPSCDNVAANILLALLQQTFSICLRC